MTTAEHEPGDAEGVYAELSYVSPHSRINRRYVAPGREVNTGTYETHRVFVRNGRTASQEFSLDSHGFVLARHRSKVEHFRDRAQVDAIYTQEVEELIRRLTGADLVASIGWMVRVAGPLVPGAQPPASEVHVDMTHASAHRRARRLFEQNFPDRKGFSRFIATSQASLALCRARASNSGPSRTSPERCSASARGNAPWRSCGGSSQARWAGSVRAASFRQPRSASSPEETWT